MEFEGCVTITLYYYDLTAHNKEEALDMLRKSYEFDMCDDECIDFEVYEAA